MTMWKIKAWKQEQNKLVYIELFIQHITDIYKKHDYINQN